MTVGDTMARQNPAQRAQLRLLVVDDSEDDAYLLKAGLAARGLRVSYERVDSAPDMAAALARESWDLIVADHNMPGFDALAALEVLKGSGHDLPFIIHSGHISDRMAISAMYDGVADFIQKGNYDHLVPVIERELRGAAARREARQAGDRLKELVNFDALSALPNHNLFCNRLADWLAAEAASRGGALFVLDIDRFLRVNTSFGYDAGNHVLRDVGRRLAAAVAPEVLLARLGGDEFGVFVPGLVGEEATADYARWLVGLFSEPFLKDHIELYLTPSMGVTRVPEDGCVVFDLLMNAEAAKGVAKRAGGNGFRFYDPDMSLASAERLAMEADLRHAIDRNELFLMYQPVVSADTGVVESVEALVRWQHPRLGLVPPDRFIPLADETGVIIDLGAWVLREACLQGRRWHDAGLTDLHVSVNVSAVQFAQPSLLQSVADALAGADFSPRHLTLEITESSLMHDVEATAAMLRALKHMQVSISVDDFGTGYSSLSYLKRFPIDVIKIDKSFVRDLCRDEEDAAIVRAIIALARSMRRRTLAEGVEGMDQVEALRAEGCELFQGYHFSRPVPAERIVPFVVGRQLGEDGAYI